MFDKYICLCYKSVGQFDFKTFFNKYREKLKWKKKDLINW